MSDDLVKMCRRLSKYAHAQLSASDLERIADRIEELEAKLVTKKTCPLGKDCDLTIAWMAGRESAKDEAKARIEELEAKLATCKKYRDAYAEMGRIGTEAYRDLEALLVKAEHIVCILASAEWDDRLGEAVDLACAYLAEVEEG